MVKIYNEYNFFHDHVMVINDVLIVFKYSTNLSFGFNHFVIIPTLHV